jgi:3',5'-cyclic AMP phosphodiesterase CpdA
MINLVQISDLHIGSLFDNAKGSFASGFNAHDVKLCQALMQFLDEDVYTIEGVSEDAPPYLIVNGDLTCTGEEREFEIANTYLFSRHAIVKNNRRRLIGLAQQPDRFASIPGNHDHWSGSWVWPRQTGYSRQIYDQFFSPLPYSVETLSSQGLELVIFGIDSCSMFEDSTANINPLANGGFSRKHRWHFQRLVVDRLRQVISEACAYRIPVILCHHPFSKDGAAGPLLTRSAKWLGKLAARYGIRLIFTGHTHRTWTNLMNIHTREGWKEVREVRCPTTLQYPAQLDASLRKPGLWLHQVSVHQEQIGWRSTLLLFSESSFYVSKVVDSDTRRPSLIEENIPNLEVL